MYFVGVKAKITRGLIVILKKFRKIFVIRLASDSCFKNRLQTQAETDEDSYRRLKT